MTESDLDAIAGLLGDQDVMRYYPRPKTRGEALGWIRWNLANYARDGFGLWILEGSDGTFVGECRLTWQQVDGRTDNVPSQRVAEKVGLTLDKTGIHDKTGRTMAIYAMELSNAQRKFADGFPVMHGDPLRPVTDALVERYRDDDADA